MMISYIQSNYGGFGSGIVNRLNDINPEEIESAHPSFDKNKAAAELRGYLGDRVGAVGRDKLTGRRPDRDHPDHRDHHTAASAFGTVDPNHAQAS